MSKAEYLVKFPEPEKLVNKVFTPIFSNAYRFIVLYGGRNSGKSFSVSRRIIQKCIEEKYCKVILIRKTFESIKDSQFQNIIDDIEAMGLQELVKVTKSPLEIVFKNGNKILCRGCDNPSKIRSIANPTCIWWEEISELDDLETFLTISSSLRSTRQKILQEFLTFNPEFGGNAGGYEEHFLFKMFFKKNYPKKSFEDELTIKMPSGEKVTSKFIVIHSTYQDNPYVTLQQKADLEYFKNVNSYYFEIFTLGNFGHKNVESRFFKNFDKNRHVKKLELDIDDALHVSFDENVNPFPAFQIFQVKDKKIKLLHEICLRNPRNKLVEVAKEFIKWTRDNKWEGGRVNIFGDQTSAKESVLLKTGVNYFTLLAHEIGREYNTKICKGPSNKNPGVSISGDFCNALFMGYDGYELLVDPSCKETINDFLLVRESTDGKMMKVKNNKGVELLGHCGDSYRYLCVQLLKDVFDKYKGRLHSNNYVIQTREQEFYDSDNFY